MNLYVYCHNDPINKVDVLGLAETVATKESIKDLPDARDALNKKVNQRIQELKAYIGKNVPSVGGVVKKETFAKHLHLYLTKDKKMDDAGNHTFMSQYIAFGKNSKVETLKGSKYEGGLKVQPLALGYSKIDTRVAGNIDYASGLWKEASVLARSINIAGEPIGTDKIDHIFFDGYKRYEAELTAKESIAQSAKHEKGYAGLAATGIYSNADIYADSFGRQFYSDVQDAINNDRDYTFELTAKDAAMLNENKNKNTYTADVQKLVDKNTGNNK